MTIEYVEASPDDAEAIAWVRVTCWQETYRGLLPDEYLDRLSFESKLKIWQEALASQGNFVLLARHAGVIVGFISSGPVSSLPSYGADGEIYALYLLAGYHGQGIGSRLFRSAAKRWAGKGGKSLIVMFLDGNAKAAAFYNAHGGREVGQGAYEIAGKPFKDLAFRVDDLAAL